MWENLKKKKYIKKTILVILIGFLIFWLGSLAHVWFLTASHGEVFKEIIVNDDWFGTFREINRVRVLEFSEDFARVYFSSIRGTHETDTLSRDFRPRTRLGGELLHFRKRDGEWHIVFWDTIWARTGTADGFIWPLIR
ncbi:MAG: hypothetical protein FWE02_06690 [Defluviitaleaceae bacterium]|nr:hypothetical protein [Defluviitaleaceae bacterium]